MIDKRERVYQAFGAFLADFVSDLNQRWVLLVEGARDESAMRTLGYRGRLLTVRLAVKMRGPGLGGQYKVMILTDLDREGTSLAAKLVRRLSHEGVRASLVERRRLKAASRGVFLHVENLSRFAKAED